MRGWYVTDGQSAFPPLHGHTNTVNAVATAVIDGHQIAVTGSDDHTVQVWDLAESDRPVPNWSSRHR